MNGCGVWRRIHFGHQIDGILDVDGAVIELVELAQALFVQLLETGLAGLRLDDPALVGLAAQPGATGYGYGRQYGGHGEDSQADAGALDEEEMPQPREPVMVGGAPPPQQELREDRIGVGPGDAAAVADFDRQVIQGDQVTVDDDAAGEAFA